MKTEGPPIHRCRQGGHSHGRAPALPTRTRATTRPGTVRAPCLLLPSTEITPSPGSCCRGQSRPGTTSSHDLSLEGQLCSADVAPGLGAPGQPSVPM